ncbi:hypothetical protein U9R90_13435 [Streptomyces sp. E11-3]|uniref:hypothetical protein n=1 Tax=Streptomyces sp. E11-3 TaxID=3110112 RepID=UPI003980B3F6
MSAPERETQPRALSMRDLLASCAAASAVSTPPRLSERREEPDTKAKPVRSRAARGEERKDAA